MFEKGEKMLIFDDANCRLLNEDELQLNNDHYDGGNTEQPALIVKNATPSDMGVYSCVLENSVGESNTQDFIEVSVLCEYQAISVT